MSIFNEDQAKFLSTELGISVDTNSNVKFDNETLFKIDDYCATLEMNDAWKISNEGGVKDVRTDVAYSILCEISEEVAERYIAQQ